MLSLSFYTIRTTIITERLAIFIKIRIKFGNIKRTSFHKTMNFCKMVLTQETKKYSDLEKSERKRRREISFSKCQPRLKITISNSSLIPNQFSAGDQRTKRLFNFNSNKLWKSVQLLTSKQEPHSLKLSQMRKFKN